MSYLKEIESLTNKLDAIYGFNKKLLMAINSSHEGIAILDPDGKYVYMNRAHEAMFGYDEGEMIGESWTMLYSSSDVEWFINEVFPKIGKDGYWTGDATAIKKDGKGLVEEVVYLTALEGGGLVCTCRDKNFHNRSWGV